MIYKRGKKFWIGYTDSAGRWIRESTGSERRIDAEKLLDIRRGERRDARRPELKETKRIKFAAFAEKYERDFCSTIKSGKGWASFLKKLTSFFGSYYLDQIGKELVAAYRRKRSGETAKNTGRKISLCTVQRELAILRHLLNTAVEWGELRFNPAGKFRLKKEPKRERVFSDAEIAAMIAEAGVPLRHFIIMAANTGMRRGEILGLTWGEVDLRRRQITLNADRTKTGETRHIELNDSTFRLLSELRLKRSGHDAVFTNPATGKPYRWINQGWQRLLRRCRIEPRGRFHDLRHSWASKVLEAGANPVDVQQALGHENIRTTSRYSHSWNRAARQRMAKLVEYGERESGEVIEHPAAEAK